MKLSIRGKHYIFRQANIDDIALITDLYNQGIKIANADLHPVSVDSRKRWFLAHDDTRPIMGLYDDNRLIAWASLSNLYDRPAYYISVEISIYIDKAYQGQGIGTGLLSQMLIVARQIGIMNVTALIYKDNHASMALFGKAGFEVWGRLPLICEVDGVYKDVMILGKCLSSRLP